MKTLSVKFFGVCLVALLCGGVFAAPARAQSTPAARPGRGPAPQVVLTPLKPGGVYGAGEQVGWEVRAADRNTTTASYTLKRNGLEVYKQGTLDLASGQATLSTTLDAPGAVLLELRPGGGAGARRGGARFSGTAGRGMGGARILAGAVVAPERLEPTAPRPADFDAFWEAQINKLHQIPANPRLTPADGGNPNVEYAKISLDNINGTHINGQLARPKKEGKFPAVLQLQWAGGPYPLEKPWVTDRAAKGWLALNIEPHDVAIDLPRDAYAQLGLATFQSIGQEDREKCYFLRMYLSAYRAIDYLSERPDWDGKTLVLEGTSMGGQQTLCLAGLHPKVTAALALVPAGCDATGPQHGRAAGFPDWARDAAQKQNSAILETGRYFDPVNFASRITCPTLVALGLIDETCPPSGVYTACNQIKVPHEVVVLINSPHQDVNNSQQPYRTRSAEWLAALAKGEPAPVKARP